MPSSIKKKFISLKQHAVEKGLLFLLNEGDYGKNLKELDITPDSISHYSPKKVGGICPYGHSYQSTCGHRLHGSQCPICNQKRQTSFHEQAIFYYVKKLFPKAVNKYKDIFSKQMELDIFIPELNIGIEFDGSTWHRDKDVLIREQKKYQICKQHKIKLIRVRQEKIDLQASNNCDMAFVFKPSRDYQYIEFEVISLLRELTKFSNKFIDFRQLININRDANEIRGYLSKVKNSLVETHPGIAKQGDYKNNGNLKPNMFTYGSMERVWGICPECGKSYKAIISRRTKYGTLCPKCACKARGKNLHIKILNKQKPISVTHPGIAKQGHPTKNGSLTPNDVTIGSSQKIWGICDKGHVGLSPCCTRKESGCPYCSNLKAFKGETDIFTKHPELKQYWDFNKNNIDTSNVHYHSKKQFYGKCPKCGFEGKQSVIQMAKKPRNKCPACSNTCLVIGINDLQTKHPEILKYWDYSKNKEEPKNIKATSSKSYYGKCPKCGFEGKTRIDRQVKANHCRSCEKSLHGKQRKG